MGREREMNSDDCTLPIGSTAVRKAKGKTPLATVMLGPNAPYRSSRAEGFILCTAAAPGDQICALREFAVKFGFFPTALVES
jgi:hypothetical protein